MIVEHIETGEQCEVIHLDYDALEKRNAGKVMLMDDQGYMLTITSKELVKDYIAIQTV